MSSTPLTHAPPQKSWLRCLLPSFLGIFLFMVPIPYQESLSIPIAILAKSVLGGLDGIFTLIVTISIALTALLTLINKLFRPTWGQKYAYVNQLLNPTFPWFLVQQLGAIFVVMSYFEIGSSLIYQDTTGGLVLNDLLPVLFSVFLFAGLCLPLLLNFGLLDFFGAICTPIMRPLFNLPGRASVNCWASWLGDGSVGVLLTSKQYEQGKYTQKEAAIIGTTFSAVSITFSLVVLAQVGLEHLFLPFYLTVCVAGFVAALIIPRLPPLSRKKDLYIDGSPRVTDAEAIPSDKKAWQFGLEQALVTANQQTSFKLIALEGLKNAADMILGVLPVVMTIGTVGLIVAETTPLFSWLGQPFIPLLEWLHIPEATEAAKTTVVGFADMFLPSILASGIESDLTRFVIAAMSVTQLIFMSETGALILGSKIPVKLWELFIIFLLRTLITLPVIAGIAHLIF